MRHRVKGRSLGRTPSHRKAMFRNMACSLIRSVRVDDDARNKPATPGRIVTTLQKAKELRPFVEKLITIARKAGVHQERAREFATSAEHNTSNWKSWRESEQWNQWNQAIAPAVACRRRAFALLRDREAVDILFDELAERFQYRDGGYTRVVRLATPRLGDAGTRAFIEFVGENDRVRSKRRAPVVADDELEPAVTADEPESEQATDTDLTEADTASAASEEDSTDQDL